VEPTREIKTVINHLNVSLSRAFEIGPEGIPTYWTIDGDQTLNYQGSTFNLKSGDGVSVFTSGLFREIPHSNDIKLRILGQDVVSSANSSTIYNEDGSVAALTLDSPMTFIINGFSYPVDKMKTLEFFKSGVPKALLLEKQTTVKVGGHSLVAPAGSLIKFYDTGEISSLVSSADTRWTVNGRNLSFLGGQDIEFHPSGIIKSGVLKADASYPLGDQTVTLLKGSGMFRQGLSKTAFYPNGALAEAYLYIHNPVVLNIAPGVAIGAGRNVKFEKNETALRLFPGRYDIGLNAKGELTLQIERDYASPQSAYCPS
jgi:hypothetical protein